MLICNLVQQNKVIDSYRPNVKHVNIEKMSIIYKIKL